MQEPEGSHVCRYRHFPPPDSCWNEYEFISQSSVPCLGPPPPQINDCLSSFAPNHDQDAEAIENVYSSFKKRRKKWKQCSSMLHKVACFHFDGIANQSDVIYVCFEFEMSPGCDIGGGPTLLGAAKPYGEFTHRFCSQSNRLETE